MSAESITVGPLRSKQVDELAKLLSGHRISLLGQLEQSLLIDFLHDAAQSDNPGVVVAATNQGRIVGWTIAISDSRRYWRGFLVRHPLHCARVLRTELYRRLRGMRAQGVASEVDSAAPLALSAWLRQTDADWGRSRKDVARHVDITVLEDFRGGKLASQLYASQRTTLRLRGVTRMDACIRADNIRSQRFHLRDEWLLVRADVGWLYITKSTAEV